MQYVVDSTDEEYFAPNVSPIPPHPPSVTLFLVSAVFAGGAEGSICG